jgi:hypothetical protein
MISFHFDLGNSTVGAIGVCARVQAETKEQAVERLQAYLEVCATVELKPRYRHDPDSEHIEYCNVYCNGDAVTVDDIDEEEEIDDDDQTED